MRMTNMTSPLRKRDEKLAVYEGARKLAKWGRVLYWTGRILAILILGLAVLFAGLDREPFFQRVASVLVLGVVPAVLVWGGGFVIYNLLKDASALYDWTATALRRFSTSLGFVWNQEHNGPRARFERSY